jgi:hypothetical protein
MTAVGLCRTKLGHWHDSANDSNLRLKKKLTNQTNLPVSFRRFCTPNMDPLGTVNAASGMASTASTFGDMDVLSIRGLGRLVPLLHLGALCTRPLLPLSRVEHFDSLIYSLLSKPFYFAICWLSDLTVDSTSWIENSDKSMNNDEFRC